MKIILWVIIFSSTFSISFYYGRDISQFIISTIQKKESFKEAGKEINQKSNKDLENQSKEITLNNKAKNNSKITLANKEEKLIDQMRSSPHYKEVQKKMSKSEASGFIYDFMTKINLEDGPFMNALNDEIEESFYKEAEKILGNIKNVAIKCGEDIKNPDIMLVLYPSKGYLFFIT